MDQHLEKEGLVHLVAIAARARVRGDLSDNMGMLACGGVYYDGDVQTAYVNVYGQATKDPATCLRCIAMKR